MQRDLKNKLLRYTINLRQEHIQACSKPTKKILDEHTGFVQVVQNKRHQTGVIEYGLVVNVV